MKQLFKILFLIPRLIVNIIWSFLKTILVFTILILLLLFLISPNKDNFTSDISSQLRKIPSFFKSDLNLKEMGRKLATDSYQHQEGNRWETNSAKVYIASTNSTLKEAYQSAIENWNATGSFHFTIVSDQAAANIIATDHSDSQTQAAGVAETQTNALTNRISHVDVKLNTYYLLNEQYGYTQERIIHTAEHELGHAIGLNHNDSEASVMESSGSYHGIQPDDIAAVKKLYSS
ncbi:M57 family metalloprotease [Streptococcus macacae]|uniref:Matrixin n=1 Tax=Streptococcus macacae NCTC 11558 TaxID=764298 RepID=G5JVM0_9STRE|nr:M57 family metalloprotease [Streptococcus macacae]EHJ52972.1 matrixin [Streptococcus macacae NCTC 11558]SUN78688.1 Zn-dependent protease [Streptococcus macacae NCTC 11558]